MLATASVPVVKRRKSFFRSHALPEGCERVEGRAPASPSSVLPVPLVAPADGLGCLLSRRRNGVSGATGGEATPKSHSLEISDQFR